MSETTCLHCRDLKRQYGWYAEDLKAAARKLVRSGGAEKYAIAVRDAKFRKGEIAGMLNAHAAEGHPEGGAA